MCNDDDDDDDGGGGGGGGGGDGHIRDLEAATLAAHLHAHCALVLEFRVV